MRTARDFVDNVLTHDVDLLPGERARLTAAIEARDAEVIEVCAKEAEAGYRPGVEVANAAERLAAARIRAIAKALSETP